MKFILNNYFIIIGVSLNIVLILYLIYMSLQSKKIVYKTDEDIKNELIEKILKEIPTLKREKLNELNRENLEKILEKIQEKKRKEIEKEIENNF